LYDPTFHFENVTDTLWHSVRWTLWHLGPIASVPKCPSAKVSGHQLKSPPSSPIVINNPHCLVAEGVMTRSRHHWPVWNITYWLINSLHSSIIKMTLIQHPVRSSDGHSNWC